MTAILRRAIHAIYQDRAGGADAGGGGAVTDAGGGAAGGAGEVKITPEQAREFVSTFVTDPKSLEKLDDATILAEHTRLRGAVDKVRPESKKWEETWREGYAGDDKKKLDRLGRYATPHAALDALLSVQNRISAGELRSALPKEGASPEQLKAWREENGIPEAADKYDIKIKGKDPIPDEDKPMFKAMAERVYGANFSNAQLNAVADWYYDESKARIDQLQVRDTQMLQATEDTLRAEWGNEYRLNMNLVNGLIDTMPADVKDLFRTGRLANGDPIMANPIALKALNAWAREINPVTALVPGGGDGVATQIDTELNQIQTWMKAPKGSADWKKYWEDEKISGPGGRYSQLLEGKEKLARKK